MNRIKNEMYYIGYEFEGDDFTYRVDLDQVKEDLIYIYLKETCHEGETCTTTKDVLDQMDYEGFIDWYDILNSDDIYECLQAHYLEDAEEEYYDNFREEEQDDYQVYKDRVSDTYE